jgi:signal transduction histidine kinase
MDRFHRTGAGSGVGLAGIRERMKELGGDFTICSTKGGTTLRSAVPLCVETTVTEPAPIPEAKKEEPASPLDTLVTNVDRAS